MIFLSVDYVYAQDVTVKLSIVWKSSKKSFIANEVLNIPYLNIHYENKTGVPVYLHRISMSEIGFPMFPISTVFSNQIKSDKLNDYSDIKYRVLIEDNSDLSSMWMVIPDSVFNVNDDNEHEVDLINDDLSYMYSRLKNEHKTDSFPAIMDEDEYFWDEISNHFVFLKAHETYTDSFNLYGFLKLHGTYQFQVNSNRVLRNYVTILVLSDKFIRIKKKLPNQMNGYQLYDKPFKGDSIKVSF